MGKYKQLKLVIAAKTANTDFIMQMEEAIVVKLVRGEINYLVDKNKDLVLLELFSKS